MPSSGACKLPSRIGDDGAHSDKYQSLNKIIIRYKDTLKSVMVIVVAKPIFLFLIW